MLKLTPQALRALQVAAREIGETIVTIATDSGVITFDFSDADHPIAKPLPYESTPTRQQLAALFDLPVTAETA